MSKVLPLRYWDDPVLSKVCEEIADSGFGPQLEEFGRELIATMSANSGVGLAAPQVGVPSRVFVMLFPDRRELEPVVVCNPELDLRGGVTAENEGCLSVPGIYIPVDRSEKVAMQYRDPLGEYHEILIDQWDARVAIHENDHLNGVMFFTRVSRQLRRQALREWEKTKKNYRT